MPRSAALFRPSVWLSLLYRCRPVFLLLRSAVYRGQLFFLRFYKDADDVAFLADAARRHGCWIQPFEAYTLLSIARMQSEREGAMAELGIYRGGSARIICRAKGSRPFFGFDTFAGLPADGEACDYGSTAFFKKGMFAAREEEARRALEEYAHVTLVKGVFPQSAQALPALRDVLFSLVHIDADLYASIREGLEYFWDRMVPGGMIVVHDTNAAGVGRALRDFRESRHPRTFELYASQTVFIK